MSIFKNPDWLKPLSYSYEKFEDIPETVFNEINTDLDKIQSDNPTVSIIIIAWNEEINILRCIASLSKTKTTIPLEIIVVNNNSKDKTQETIDKLHIKGLFQEIQGCGPARQMGLEAALGKYVLTGDADALYPPNWVEKMMKELQKPGVVCVYGRYSFIGNAKVTRWKLAFYEWLRDSVAFVRHFKRPHFNTLGMTMGYVKKPALKVGYVMRNIRGEDGRLVFDLLKQNIGKLVCVKAMDSRVWTGQRTLERDGSFTRAFLARLGKELKQFKTYFKAQAPHDTKTSEN
jgi:glycosyltransferase involved in cell wall biosynthesis